MRNASRVQHEYETGKIDKALHDVLLRQFSVRQCRGSAPSPRAPRALTRRRLLFARRKSGLARLSLSEAIRPNSDGSKTRSPTLTLIGRL